MAAMEALWETQDPAPFSLVANIDTKAQKDTGALEIPGGLSFLTQNSFTSGKVEGIKDLQAKAEAQYGLATIFQMFQQSSGHSVSW